MRVWQKKNILHPILRTEGETQPYTQPDQFLCTGSLWARLSLAFVLAASCNQNAVMIVKNNNNPLSSTQCITTIFDFRPIQWSLLIFPMLENDDPDIINDS